MKVRFQIVDSILDEVESIQRRIAERAEKLFHERGRQWAIDRRTFGRSRRQTLPVHGASDRRTCCIEHGIKSLRNKWSNQRGSSPYSPTGVAA